MIRTDQTSFDMCARIAASVEDATPAEKTIATYLQTNLKTLPFENAVTVARKAGVSEASIGRYCRRIGLASFKDLKARLQADLGENAWLIGDRLRDFHSRSRDGNAELGRALKLEMAALVAVYELAADTKFSNVVTRLAHTPNVFVAGFQTERGHAQFLTHGLQYLRRGVQLADTAGGTFSEVLTADPAQTCIVLFDGRKYSRLAERLARKARAGGFKVTLITDTYCAWGGDAVDEMFAVPTDLNLFWDNTAPMASLVSLLVNGVFNELGSGVEARMARVSALHNEFVGHVGGSPK